MSVKEMFSEEESRLFNYIKTKVKDSVQKYCQWKTSLELFSIIEAKEELEFDVLGIKIMEWLEQFAPLHYSCLTTNPLSTISNDTCIFHESQELDEAYAEHEITYWSLVTYKELKDQGFSLYFCRKTIGKYLGLEKLKQKSNYNGNYYVIINDKAFEKSIVNSNLFIKAYGGDLVRSKSKTIVLKQFTKKEINELFSKYKTSLFNYLKENHDN